jgi:20S proteasome subunit alpha 7
MFCEGECVKQSRGTHLLQAARNEIEKLKLNELTARQAVIEVAKILYKVPESHDYSPVIEPTAYTASITICVLDLQRVCYCLCPRVQVHDDDGKPFDIELSWVCEESGRKHARVPAELLDEAVRAAKAAAEADSDMCV